MDNTEPINKLAEQVKERFEKIGLYMVDVNVATSDQDALAEAEAGALKEDFRKKLADGESQWLMMAVFNIGDQAFSNRVLDPEAEKEDTEFRTAMPSEVEIMQEKFRREGMAAWGLDEEDE